MFVTCSIPIGGLLLRVHSILIARGALSPSCRAVALLVRIIRLYGGVLRIRTEVGETSTLTEGPEKNLHRDPYSHQNFTIII